MKSLILQENIMSLVNYAQASQGIPYLFIFLEVFIKVLLETI